MYGGGDAARATYITGAAGRTGRIRWTIQRGCFFMANNTETQNESLLIDEFEIIELEDRLELANRCNGRCDGQTKPPTSA
jgi:hypothetical protein